MVLSAEIEPANHATSSMQNCDFAETKNPTVHFRLRSASEAVRILAGGPVRRLCKV